MPTDKSKNAQEMLNILQKAYGSPPSIITFTEDYVYTMFPTNPSGDKWLEVSFITPDGTIDKKELSSKDAIMYLIKEIVEGLASYFDLPIVKDKDSFEKAISQVRSVMK
ncbi:MAG: hypothetical protein WED05_01035 [Candidatus Atabeyarchaeum deiterrae]|jgi:hypothetical protein